MAKRNVVKSEGIETINKEIALSFVQKSFRLNKKNLFDIKL